MIGMMILCDEEGMKDVKQLALIKNYILSIRRAPVLHILGADHGSGKREEEEFRKTLEIKRDERIFTFEPAHRDNVPQIFTSFFGYLLKDEYIST